MPIANIMLIGLAEDAGGLPLRCWTLEEFGAAFSPNVFVYQSAHGEVGHIPGDTTTPPAPGAVWIGSGDA